MKKSRVWRAPQARYRIKDGVLATKLVEAGSAARFWPSGPRPEANGVVVFDGPNSRPHRRGDKALGFITVVSGKK